MVKEINYGQVAQLAERKRSDTVRRRVFDSPPTHQIAHFIYAVKEIKKVGDDFLIYNFYYGLR